MWYDLTRMAKALNAGGEVDSFCTKCKMVLNHRVIAMVEGIPVRVECSTCSSHHNYRPRAPGDKGPAKEKVIRRTSGTSSTASSGRQTGGVRAAVRAEEQRVDRERFWEKSVSGKTVDQFRPYKVTETFAEGDLVRHGKFGDGIVTRILDAKKVEVLFRDEPRTLAQDLD